MTSQRIGTATCGVVGVAFVVGVIAARQSWLDRHFLPSFFLTHEWYVRMEAIVRVAVGAIGISLVVARRRIGHALGRTYRYAVPTVCAALVGLGMSEIVLRRVHLRPTEWLLPQEEPRRRADQGLGWVLEPARRGHSIVGGRSIEYAIDPAGYRVRSVEESVDPVRPTIVFTGESVMFGEGLPWDESIPAQVGSLLAVQPANLAVHGYSNDQAYLRLARELPRFQRPVAVVTLFMTALFGRNLDDDRPHLDPDLVWRPAEPNSRLASLAALLVPYRRESTVDRGIRITREVLGATVRLAQSCGARALIVVPQMGRESRLEASLRRAVLDSDGLPYVFVEIDPAWHLPWDRHPNGAAAHVIAEAVADRLRAH